MQFLLEVRSLEPLNICFVLDDSSRIVLERRGQEYLDLVGGTKSC